MKAEPRTPIVRHPPRGGGIPERAIADLGWDHLRLPHPLSAGDTLYAESSEVLDVRYRRGGMVVGARTMTAFQGRRESR